MPTPRYEDTLTAPLTSDHALLDRVGELIGPAIRRQTWMLFLDAADVQLPFLMPADDLPDVPAPQDERIAATVLETFATATGAAALVVVLERPGADALDDGDRRWAGVWHCASAATGVRVRATLLSSDHGIRWIGPDDWA